MVGFLHCSFQTTMGSAQHSTAWLILKGNADVIMATTEDATDGKNTTKMGVN